MFPVSLKEEPKELITFEEAQSLLNDTIRIETPSLYGQYVSIWWFKNNNDKDEADVIGRARQYKDSLKWLNVKGTNFFKDEASFLRSLGTLTHTTWTP